MIFLSAPSFILLRKEALERQVLPPRGGGKGWGAAAVFGLTFFSHLCFHSCSLAGFFPDRLFAEDSAGTAGAAFLKNPAGARAQAMGGSGLALGGIEAVFWNPAGLAQFAESGSSGISLSYEQMLETAYRSNLAYAAASSGAVFGIGAVFMSQSPLEAYSPAGDPAGSISAYDATLSATYSKYYGGKSMGFTVKFISSNIAGEKGVSAAADAGLLLRDSLNLGGAMADVSLSARNFGPPIKIGSESDPLPMELGAGLLWHFYKNFEIISDLKMPVDRSPYASIGAEMSFGLGRTDYGALRFGYDFRKMKDIGPSAAFSAGGGLGIGFLRIDYAWVPFGELGTTHRITLGFKRGTPVYKHPPRIPVQAQTGSFAQPSPFPAPDVPASAVSAPASSEPVKNNGEEW